MRGSEMSALVSFLKAPTTLHTGTIKARFTADLYPGGLLEVSDDDSVVLAEIWVVGDTHEERKFNARKALELSFGHAGRHIYIDKRRYER